MWYRRWWRVAEDYDTEPIQLSLAALLLLWSALIAAPFNAWVVAVTYTWLDKYTDPWMWVCASLPLGILWVYGFVLRRPRLRMWCAWGSLMFWTVLSVGSFIASPYTFGWIAYGTFAVQSGWVFLRRGGG